MKVLMIIPTYYPIVGEREAVVCHLTAALNRDGVPTDIMTFNIDSSRVCKCARVGDIEIADGIAVGANSFVNKSFKEPGISIAGAPARKISNKGSEGLHIRATEILKNVLNTNLLNKSCKGRLGLQYVNHKTS